MSYSLVTSPYIRQLIGIFQNTIDKIQQGNNNQELIFSPSKTQCFTFSKKRKLPPACQFKPINPNIKMLTII